MPNMKIKVCKAAPKVCEPSVWTWLRVTLPASIVLRWHLDFWQTIASRYVHSVELLTAAPDHCMCCPLAVLGQLLVPV